MKRESQRPKALLGLLVALALIVSIVIAVPVTAQPSFTGDVEADFTGPGVLIIDDPLGDVGMPGTPPGISGWEMKELRLFYHAATDTMYVGINTFTILGDADGDGDPSITSAYLADMGGTDIPNLGESETAAVYFDLDQDGTWDVIGGISGVTDYSGFSVNAFTGPFFPPTNFGAPLPGNTGSISPNPDAAHPDLEFTITNWSTLPGHDASVGFKVGAFLGSQQDAGIGEDLLEASYGPAAINIVKKTNGTDNNSPTGPYIPVGDTVNWTYEVTNPGSENLTNIVVTDDNGTPGNPGDDWNPTYVSGDDGNDGILEPYSLTGETWLYEASGNATVGQYANSANATGDFDGFTVSDTDPDHYRGVDARISIQASDTNPVNTAHNFTVTVEMNDGTGWAAASNVSVTANLTGVGSIISTNPDLTDINGQVIVTVNSTLPGMATVHASGTVNVGGVNIDVATNGYGAYNVSNEKTWEAGACIHIEKITNGEDADDPEGPHIALGGNVTWEYVVTNCGDVPVGNITVTDDQGVIPIPVDLDEDGFIDGDINEDGLLDLAETWVYRASGNATVGQYANIATVIGYYGIVLLTDSDPSHYFGLGPAIHIEKHTNGVDADSPPGPLISINSTVTWTYYVTNTGAVNLTGIVVTDNKPGVTPVYVSGDDGSDGILEPYSQTGETWVYQATGVAVAGQYANIGTVRGYYGAVEVTDTDPSHYYNRPTVGWETYPINKVRVLLPWIALLAAVMVAASLLVLRHRRAQS